MPVEYVNSLCLVPQTAIICGKRPNQFRHEKLGITQGLCKPLWFSHSIRAGEFREKRSLDEYLATCVRIMETLISTSLVANQDAFFGAGPSLGRINVKHIVINIISPMAEIFFCITYAPKVAAFAVCWHCTSRHSPALTSDHPNQESTAPTQSEDW